MKTKEEILSEHFSNYFPDGSYFRTDDDHLAAMEEYKDQETAELRAKLEEAMERINQLESAIEWALGYYAASITT